MTSCRPSRRTSFPSLGDTTGTLAFRSRHGRVLPRRAWGWSPGSPSRDFFHGDDRISYVPGEPLLCSCPALRPRQDRRIRPCNASARPPICPPRRLLHSYFRGSITRLRHWLSTLRRPGRPDTTQDSLPAAGQALPDGLDYPQGSSKRFQTHIMCVILLFQAFVAQGHYTFSVRPPCTSARQRDRMVL